MMKKRILNAQLASIVARMRHGEMLFIADAGSGTTKKSLYPLSEDVEYLDLGVVTGSPSFQDVIETLVECGDFEGAIVTENMLQHNLKDYHVVENLFDAKNIHAQAILIAGYPSADIPMEWLKNGLKGESHE